MNGPTWVSTLPAFITGIYRGWNLNESGSSLQIYSGKYNSQSAPLQVGHHAGWYPILDVIQVRPYNYKKLGISRFSR